MPKSKATISNRLRKVGLFDAYSRRRDELVKQFRSSGVPRFEAVQQAWDTAASEPPYAQALADPGDAPKQVEPPQPQEAPEPPEVKAILAGADATPSMISDLAWAYAAIANPAAGPAPSHGAAALLTWGRMAQARFFDLASRLLVPRQVAEEAEAARKAARTTEMQVEEIEAMLLAQQGKAEGEGAIFEGRMAGKPRACA